MVPAGRRPPMWILNTCRGQVMNEVRRRLTRLKSPRTTCTSFFQKFRGSRDHQTVTKPYKKQTLIFNTSFQHLRDSGLDSRRLALYTQSLSPISTPVSFATSLLIFHEAESPLLKLTRQFRDATIANRRIEIDLSARLSSPDTSLYANKQPLTAGPGP